MSDYAVNLREDWKKFVQEVKTLRSINPDISISEIERRTGGDYEDILWALEGR